VQARLRRLAAVQVASWTEAKTAIENIASGSSGTVTLAAGFNCGYNGQITVTGNVTVHGYGAICDAAQAGRFFWVNSGAQLALDAMALKNGYSSQVSPLKNHYTVTTMLTRWSRGPG
jgi:dihydrodipicolinate synthase/N-acetylneuraminate lyase